MNAAKTSTTVAQNSVRTFVARLAAAGLTIATGVVTAKGLGPAGKGLYSGTLMLVSFVMVVPSGIATAFVYALTKQRRSLEELMPAAGRILAYLCIAAGLGAVVWAAIKGPSPVIWIFLASVPPSTVLTWQGSLYIGLGRMNNLNIQTFGIALATLVCIAIAVFVLHGNAVAALVAWLVCLYGGALVVVWHALRLSRRADPGDVSATVRGLARFGAPNSLNQLLGTLNYRIDSIILISLLGLGSFGIYSIAVNFGELLFMLTRPITAAATRDIGIREVHAAGVMTAKVIRVCTAIAALASLAAFALGPWVIDTVFGPRFSSGAEPLRILLPGIVAFATAGTFAAFFIVQLGRPHVVTVINVVMIAIQAVACFVLVPRLGMSGAALASTVTYIAGAGMNTVWFCRATSVSPWDVWVVRSADIRLVLQETRAMWRRERAASAA
ncbi:MAG TPA: oligosaccharide flippase family protein [Candidatus Acidoferrales bacterium]|nr:oligosaccharide flippase family protein [Candidatus Acidoferrales bacterium]